MLQIKTPTLKVSICGGGGGAVSFELRLDGGRRSWSSKSIDLISVWDLKWLEEWFRKDVFSSLVRLMIPLMV